MLVFFCPRNTIASLAVRDPILLAPDPQAEIRPTACQALAVQLKTSARNLVTFGVLTLGRGRPVRAAPRLSEWETGWARLPPVA